MEHRIEFVQLREIDLGEIAAHMSDVRLREHMPLLTSAWGAREARDFVIGKEKYWEKDGLGHWAILSDKAYVGWGGFQKEGDEWDYGLVLKPDSFGLGTAIFQKALAFAQADERIDFMTFLLPLSRKKLGALRRLGARPLGEVEYSGEAFLKFRLETT
ncbi:GNAT family N-acetyltransferase [Pseudophaeobacter sp.]|uniref:GNAT family N-acetyltransferase n=1 Tax=Pseudophaeobacter sp. TaxID=1971739 RepID=UPI003298EB80